MPTNGLSPSLNGDYAAAAVLLAVLALYTPAVQANDASFGGRGSDLIPLQETRVRMVSEDIVLELVPVQDAWQVSATYVFENPTDQPVRLQLGFPEERCPPDRDCTPYAGAFRDLVTTVRGQEVPQRTGQVRGADEWAEVLGDVYLYDVEFQPRERLTVVHSYRYDRSSGVDWWGTRYLTRTGSLWAGPIGTARFTVRLPRPPLYVIYPKDFTLLRFEERPRPDELGSVTELVFEARSWAAGVDFAVTFPAAGVAAWAGQTLCPGWEAESTAEELAPLLAELGPEELRACRNHVYALHGYPFKDATLRARYYGSPPALPDWADPAQWRIAGRPEAPGFDPDWLSPGEKTLVEAIQAAEKRKK